MNSQREKWRRRTRRHLRVRRKVSGAPERPRVAVYRSLKHISAQIIDDDAGRTLVSASSLLPEIRGQVSYGGNQSAAALVGKLLAERAREKSIEQVRFDRGPYKFHGRVKALAEAAREGGLKF